MKNIVVMLFAVLLAAGCVSYEYQGRNAGPGKKAEDIRIFADAAKVRRQYEVLGTATVSGNCQDVSRDKLVNKLLSEAEKNGADAIVIIEQQVVTIGADSSEVARPFTTGASYGDSIQGRLQQDVDQDFTNIRRSRTTISAGASKRIIRAEFIKYKP